MCGYILKPMYPDTVRTSLCCLKGTLNVNPNVGNTTEPWGIIASLLHIFASVYIESVKHVYKLKYKLKYLILSFHITPALE